MMCPFISVCYDSRADKYSSSTTIFWLERLGRMNGGYDNAIRVIIIHPVYYDWLLPVTVSFIILLEQRSYIQSMVLTAIS